MPGVLAVPISELLSLNQVGEVGITPLPPRLGFKLY